MSRVAHAFHGPATAVAPHARPDRTLDVVMPGRKPDSPDADPWRHDPAAGHPRAGSPQAGAPLEAGQLAAVPTADPRLSATVHGEHHTGLLRVRLTGDGGEVGEYDLDVEQALRLAQRLRDAAAAMREFHAERTFGPRRFSR